MCLALVVLWYKCVRRKSFLWVKSTWVGVGDTKKEGDCSAKVGDKRQVRRFFSTIQGRLTPIIAQYNPMMPFFSSQEIFLVIVSRGLGLIVFYAPTQRFILQGTIYSYFVATLEKRRALYSYHPHTPWSAKKMSFYCGRIWMTYPDYLHQGFLG